MQKTIAVTRQQDGALSITFPAGATFPVKSFAVEGPDTIVKIIPTEDQMQEILANFPPESRAAFAQFLDPERTRP